MDSRSARLIRVLNRYDDIAIRTTSEFFRRHGMPQLQDRTRFEYAADFGATRPLRHMLVMVFGLNGRKFVRFYEDVFRRREAPHYEDALVVATLIISAIAAIGAYLSPIIGVEYAKRRSRAEKDSLRVSPEDSREMLDLFEYLVKAFALRGAYYSKGISAREFRKLREVAEQLVLEAGRRHSKQTIDKGIADQLDKIWGHFNRTANLSFGGQLLEELGTLAVEEIRRPRVSPRKVKGPKRRVLVTSRGLGASPGHVRGAIKVVNSSDEVGKVSEGDIGVFRYFNPDMVPALKKCVGSIGLVGCGGRTGHLAVVSRELGIPCVVRLQEDISFEDGRLAFVNGTTGEIGITL